MEQPTESSQDALASRANRLYWESERSVGRIAESLDIARGTLYGLVQPLPTGLPCPECTVEMVYANRTARDRGLLACPGCGLVEDEELIRLAWQETADGSHDGTVVVSSAPAAGVRALMPERWRGSGDGRALLGLTVLGAAAGVMLVQWLRRR